ncbi:MAG: RagB/SusD family nutrient uptake outer membrane protein [Sediminibacterium sp.]
MSKRITNLLLLIVSFTILDSCTKLNEKVLDETSAAGLTEKQVADGFIAPTYAKLEDIFMHTNYFSLQEISTDEAILPYRGGTDWGDNGIYMQLHKHENVSSDANVRNTWNNILQGISRGVTAVNGLKGSKDPNATKYLAEARGMIAYYNLLSLDLWGIAFKKEDPLANSTILRGKDAIDYIKSELLAIESSLDNTTGPGRITQAAVQGLLARVYLNYGVYTNIYGAATFAAADMAKVVEYCDKIINSGNFALAADYFSLFNDNNHTNKELIFAVDQRADLAGHNRMAYFSISGDQFPLPAYTGANGTDGPGITSDFYRSWVNAYPVDPALADPRFYKENLSIYTNGIDTCVDASAFNINRGILRGQQYGLIRKNGVFLKCVSGKMLVGKLFYDTRSKPTKPVDFTELCDYTTAGSDYNTGYRVEKYEFSKTSVSGRNFGEHDIVILRLADIYLMRAEANLRASTTTSATPLADVNKVRTARTASSIVVTPLTSITLDNLFRERGFEFYWECQRRTDMIRFGKYEGTWTEKTSTDVKKRLFPIPQTAIDATSIETGYLVQNQGY